MIKIAFGPVSGREEQQPFEIVSGTLTDVMCLEDEELYEQGFLTVIHEEHTNNIYARFTVINSDQTTRNILDGRPNTTAVEHYRFGLPQRHELLQFPPDAIMIKLDVKKAFFVVKLTYRTQTKTCYRTRIHGRDLMFSPDGAVMGENYSPRIFTFETKTIIRILNNEPSFTLLDYVDDFFGSFGTTSMSQHEIQMKTNIILTELTMCGFPLNSKFEVSCQRFCTLGSCAFLEEQRLFPKISHVWKILRLLLNFIQRNFLNIKNAEILVGKLGNV